MDVHICCYVFFTLLAGIMEPVYADSTFKLCKHGYQCHRWSALANNSATSCKIELKCEKGKTIDIKDEFYEEFTYSENINICEKNFLEANLNEDPGSTWGTSDMCNGKQRCYFYITNDYDYMVHVIYDCLDPAELRTPHTLQWLIEQEQLQHEKNSKNKTTTQSSTMTASMTSALTKPKILSITQRTSTTAKTPAAKPGETNAAGTSTKSVTKESLKSCHFKNKCNNWSGWKCDTSSCTADLQCQHATTSEIIAWNRGDSKCYISTGGACCRGEFSEHLFRTRNSEGICHYAFYIGDQNVTYNCPAPFVSISSSNTPTNLQTTATPTTTVKIPKPFVTSNTTIGTSKSTVVAPKPTIGTYKQTTTPTIETTETIIGKQYSRTKIPKSILEATPSKLLSKINKDSETSSSEQFPVTYIAITVTGCFGVLFIVVDIFLCVVWRRSKKQSRPIHTEL